MNNYFGIDTSNYRTSAAIFGNKNYSIRKLLPVKDNEIGLRQSDALFLHTKQLPVIIEELFNTSQINANSINAIAVSSKPRDIEDSYMPCFLAGVSVAKSLASVLNIKAYEFSHQEGHIAAAIYSSKNIGLFNKQFIAFHVSGGTTEALLVSPDKDGFNTKIISRTLDLNAGQVIDRVGHMLGFSFPSGADLDLLAQNHDAVFTKPSIKGDDFCLSGLENQCKAMLENKSKEYIARYLFDYIGDTITAVAGSLLNHYHGLDLLFSGGVMANYIIRNKILNNFNAYFASPEFSGDNALGTAILAAIKHGENLWN